MRPAITIDALVDGTTRVLLRLPEEQFKGIAAARDAIAALHWPGPADRVKVVVPLEDNVTAEVNGANRVEFRVGEKFAAAFDFYHLHGQFCPQQMSVDAVAGKTILLTGDLFSDIKAAVEAMKAADLLAAWTVSLRASVDHTSGNLFDSNARASGSPLTSTDAEVVISEDLTLQFLSGGPTLCVDYEVLVGAFCGETTIA